MRTEVPLVGAQLSANVGWAYANAAVHTPGAVLRGAGVGQLRVGGVKSLTMTRKVQVLIRPTPSVAFHCTVVMPLGKVAVLVLASVALAIWAGPVMVLMDSTARALHTPRIYIDAVLATGGAPAP